MKQRLAGAVVIFVVAVMLLALADWLRPRKYHVGMTLDEVVRLSEPGNLKMWDTGLETEGVSAPEVLVQAVAQEVYDREAGLIVQLNYRKVVIGVQRWKYLGIDFASLLTKEKERK